MPLYLHSMRIQRPGAISQAVYGNFSAPKAHEIVVGRGNMIELLRPSASDGKLESVLCADVFGAVRSLAAFRLTGASRDYLVLGSDSGRIVILSFDERTNSFVKVHQETFGRSGIRRVVPGEYLAVDPRGRACMIGALEKAKLVYILNRDSKANLTISSPLEAHKPRALVLACVGVDVGFENPIFACLEVFFGDADDDTSAQSLAQVQTVLTYYELDLGLNHVVRKSSEPVDSTANMLVAIPGGDDGPSGVLVCSEDCVTWRHFDAEPRSVLIPRRAGDVRSDRGTLLVASSLHRQKDLFFVLAQSELGDLFMIHVDYARGSNTVSGLRISYFDTLPVASALCILRSGALFVASEFGNHGLYRFESLGEEDEASGAWMLRAAGAGDRFVRFEPHALRNLALVDELSSLSPIADFKVLDLSGEGTPQIFAACGRGPRSSLRILRHGLEVTELALSAMPGNPQGVFTVRRTRAAATDAYIVISFVNASMVLSIGATVEECNDSGLFGAAPTLAMGSLGDDGLVQAHTAGVCHVRSDGRVSLWAPPERRVVEFAATNHRQVLLSLTGSELVLLTLGTRGVLEDEPVRKTMAGEVACLDIEALPAGRARARFAIVGGYDNTVRILSLAAGAGLFEQVAIQAVSDVPVSVALVEMGSEANRRLFACVGLASGVYMRMSIDPLAGTLSDVRSRVLGARGVRLSKVTVRGAPAVLALSSRSWLAYEMQSHYHLTPLSYEACDHAHSFASDQCPEGFVAIASSTLRIITTERLGTALNQQAVPLRCTPRRIIAHPPSGRLVVIGSDNRTSSAEARCTPALDAKRQAAADPDAMEIDNDDGAAGAASHAGAGAGAGAAAAAEPGAQQQVDEALLARTLESDVLFGAPASDTGSWSSCIELVSPDAAAITARLVMPGNVALVSLATCAFERTGDVLYVAVGLAYDLVPPRQCTRGAVRLYTVSADQLSLVHETELEGIPGVMCAFQNQLLVGVGAVLRLYDLGKARLLRKCETRPFNGPLVTLSAEASRVIVGEAGGSMHFLSYRRAEKRFAKFADDAISRHVTAACVVDYDTVIGADKFGGLFALRLEGNPDEDAEANLSAGSLQWEKGWLNGAPHKLSLLCHHHLGETVTSLQRARFVLGGPEVVVYATVSGSLGVLVPFAAREDVDFFLHLEMHLRHESPPLAGRDHLAYRSSVQPNKDVIDGVLCETFSSLAQAVQSSVATLLERTPAEVAKKLEDARYHSCI